MTTRYVDGTVVTCVNYNPTLRNRTGEDLNYETIKEVLDELASGDTANIRGAIGEFDGVYTEGYENFPSSETCPLGSFVSMATVQGYGSEVITWASDNVFTKWQLPISSITENITFKNIAFTMPKGVLVNSANGFNWTQEAGHIWYCDYFTSYNNSQMDQLNGTRLLKNTSADLWSCIADNGGEWTWGFFDANDDTQPSPCRNKEDLTEDGHYFIDHKTVPLYGVYNRLYLHSETDPNSRTDFKFDKGSIVCSTNSGGSGLIVFDSCSFTGAGHAHINIPHRLRIKKCSFIGLASEGRAHFVYIYSGARSLGNETIIENNYFHATGSQGACVHINSGDYNIIRNNIFQGDYSTQSNWWGIVASGETSVSANKVYNNIFYKFYTPVEFQNPTNYDELRNNIFMDAGYGVFAQGTNEIVTNNQLFNTTLYTEGGTGTIENNYTGDPEIFTYPPTTWTDFRLSSGSPCIGAGANLGTDNDDVLDPNDTTWPPSTVNQGDYGNWEIGAFGYTGDQRAISHAYNVSNFQNPRKIHPKF